MVNYSDIHISDLKNMSLQSFTQVLIHDYYPFIYSEINKLEEYIQNLRVDYDVEVLDMLQKKIYEEFDELYRKEKLVLFPYIIKLSDEHIQSENTSALKNTKVHYTAMLNHISKAIQIGSDFFIQSNQNHSVIELQTLLSNLKLNMIEIQDTKEKHFYSHFKEGFAF